jgi:hypothetical protein
LQESGLVEKLRDDISERALHSFDACMTGQSAYAKKALLTSIALENSSVSSFYSHNAVRRIDPQAEIKKATRLKAIS